MPEQTPYEKLVKANDEYHEVVAEIMLDENVPVALKVEFAEAVNTVFKQMKVASDIIAPHYAGGQ